MERAYRDATRLAQWQPAELHLQDSAFSAASGTGLPNTHKPFSSQLRLRLVRTAVMVTAKLREACHVNFRMSWKLFTSSPSYGKRTSCTCTVASGRMMRHTRVIQAVPAQDSNSMNGCWMAISCGAIGAIRGKVTVKTSSLIDALISSG